MKITFDKKNYRKHSEQNKKRIRKSLTECGAGRSVLVDKDGCLIAGNGVYEQAEKMGIKTRVVETDGTELVVVKRTDIGTEDDKRKLLALADNATSDSVEWDLPNIVADFDVSVAEDWGIDVDLYVNENGGVSEKHGTLCERFVVPPFSVLDARQGYWNERKKQWRELIGDNGESRQGTLAKDCIMADINNGVSLLDPVLAEVICKWFGIDGGTAFDTFAGDSVFGFVSAKLGNTFTGIELRQEQADLNNSRTQGMSAKYICDDGQNVLSNIYNNVQRREYNMARAKNYKSEQARLNEQKHQFGQPEANRRGDPTAAGRMRAFYDWCENVATVEELRAYANDESKPATRRRFVQALMKCERVQDFFDLTNQTHGAPKQVVEVQDLPTIDCKVFGDE